MNKSIEEMVLNNDLIVINSSCGNGVEDCGNGVEEEEEFVCDCKLGPNCEPCYQQFHSKDITDHRIDYQSCDYWDEDCYNLLNERIIAIMSVLINTSSEAQTTCHKRQKRSKASTKFLWKGRPVCKKLFLYVHAIKKPKWSYLKKRFLQYGVEPRQHKNKISPVNNNAISGEERKTIVEFIRGYAKENAQNPDAENAWILSAEHSVKSIYRHFRDNYSERKISYESFRNVWRTHCPGIRFEAKNDKTLIVDIIKSYAKWHSSATSATNPKELFLSAEHNVKIVYSEFKSKYNSDISYDVFNNTWKSCCPYVRFENSSHYNKRKCSHCGVDGHTKRKIGDHFLCPLQESESGLSGLMRKAQRK